MRVRIDAEDVDVGRQHVAVFDRVVRAAGGNIDRLRLSVISERRAGRAAMSVKKSPMLGWITSGLPVGSMCSCDDQVAAVSRASTPGRPAP